MEEVKKDITPPNNTANIKKKREDKQRRRDHRAIENIMKEIGNLEDGEKVRVLIKKYSDLYDEFRALQNNTALSDKRMTVLQRERDQLQSEQGKLVLAKARMESLCRELQKQNKLIKEENLAKIREEEERRKEVALKFQNTLSEVSNMVQENSEKNIKLRDDNKDMANKIQALCEQFNKRKEQLARVEKQLELERQLSEATVAKAELELKAEREMWSKEREILQSNLKKSEENCVKLQENIKSLEENLQVYSGNYKEFESTISRSNEVFDNCKSEMFKMTKQIATLEKECKMFKQRWQKNAQCVIELTATKQSQDTKIDNLERKLEQLQKLCRQLQTDRSSYIKLLKLNGIEPVSQKCVEEPASSPRKTKKEIELEHLKNNLKVLQEHFYSIQAKSVVSSSGNDEEIKENNSLPATESSVDVTEAKLTEESTTSIENSLNDLTINENKKENIEDNKDNSIQNVIESESNVKTDDEEVISNGCLVSESNTDHSAESSASKESTVITKEDTVSPSIDESQSSMTVDSNDPSTTENGTCDSTSAALSIIDSVTEENRNPEGETT
ncbi:alpha-taxilin [Agrilus planipennis]|uniref:Alpha-taxilin n=1 Tax=Agrilus planipennis TaxID=224129 RepID=A0A1W4W9F1_AGRPL|nr:alpha-taxilin [Agrilus planipennis]XP_018320674.1 alpha-taxilin [Agrilus planipennis]